jgi:hypothetical protein
VLKFKKWLRRQRVNGMFKFSSLRRVNEIAILFHKDCCFARLRCVGYFILVSFMGRMCYCKWTYYTCLNLQWTVLHMCEFLLSCHILTINMNLVFLRLLILIVLWIFYIGKVYKSYWLGLLTFPEGHCTMELV